MKVLVIEKEAPWTVYATLMIKSMLKSSNDTVDVVHVTTTSEATGIMEDKQVIADYYVVIVLGLGFNQRYDGRFRDIVDQEFDTPFTQVIWANAYGEDPMSPNIDYVTTYNDEDSTIMNLYRTLQASVQFAPKSLTEDVILGVHEYYTGKSIGADNVVGSALMGLYETFGTYLEDLFVNMNVATILQNNMQIVQHYLIRQSQYVDKKVKNASILQDTILNVPVTVGIVSAEQFKNEVAEKIMSNAQTASVIVVVLEQYGDNALFTIRTRNFDAVSVAKVIKPNAGGKFSSASAFGQLNSMNHSVGQLLINYLNGEEVDG